jgi:hypothetical protein
LGFLFLGVKEKGERDRIKGHNGQSCTSATLYDLSNDLVYYTPAATIDDDKLVDMRDSYRVLLAKAMIASLR